MFHFGPKRPGYDITIQNCIEVERPNQIIDKQAITVLNESIALCHDVVVAFGAIVFLQAKY